MAVTNDLGALRKEGMNHLVRSTPWISVGLGTCGIGNGAQEVFDALKNEVLKQKSEILVRRVGCFGFCSAEPIVMTYRPGKPLLMFTDVTPAKALTVLKSINDDEQYGKAAKLAEARIESWDFRTSSLNFGSDYNFVPTMKIKTASSRVLTARKTSVELMLASHPADCLSCIRSGSCELLNLAETLGVRATRFPKLKNFAYPDTSTDGLVRDDSKCILCGRCVAVCSETQTVNAIDFSGRGIRTRITTFMDRGLANSPCVQCGQCSVVCPTGAITEKDQSQEVFSALADPTLSVVVQTAPAIRASLGEALGMKPGSLVTGKMVAALRRLGFSKVFDTQFTADLTIMEEGTEFIQRVQNGGTLPMITSCSPGWINFIETFYPGQLANLSSCKSPQQMFGAVAKTFYAQKAGINPEKLRVVSIMPCTAKKGETKRPGRDSAWYFWEELRKGDARAETESKNTSEQPFKDIHWALTTRELARMIKMAGIDMEALPEEHFDDPLGASTGAATIFGNTGGVIEAALRTIYEILGKKPLPSTDFMPVRGLEGIKTAEVQIAGMTVRVAVAHGLQNTRALLDEIKNGQSPYHFIEIMSCPGGCIGGGGQPVLPDIQKKLARNKALYLEDLHLTELKSHQNPQVQALYDQFLKAPASHLAHELLHTGYKGRVY